MKSSDDFRQQFQEPSAILSLMGLTFGSSIILIAKRRLFIQRLKQCTIGRMGICRQKICLVFANIRLLK